MTPLLIKGIQKEAEHTDSQFLHLMFLVVIVVVCRSVQFL